MYAQHKPVLKMVIQDVNEYDFKRLSLFLPCRAERHKVLSFQHSCQFNLKESKYT